MSLVCPSCLTGAGSYLEVVERKNYDGVLEWQWDCSECWACIPVTVETIDLEPIQRKGAV